MSDMKPVAKATMRCVGALQSLLSILAIQLRALPQGRDGIPLANAMLEGTKALQELNAALDQKP